MDTAGAEGGAVSSGAGPAPGGARPAPGAPLLALGSPVPGVPAPGVAAPGVPAPGVAAPGVPAALADYAEHATMHGVWRAAQATYNRCRRLSWATSLCLSVLTLAYVVIEQLRVYGEFRVETVLSVHDRARLEFPAVTVCNYNQFRKTPTLEAGDTGAILKELFSVRDLMTTMIRKDEKSERRFSKNAAEGDGDDDIVVDDALTERLTGLAHLLNRTVLFAQWLNKPVLLDVYFTRSMTEVGVCYTFNSRRSRLVHGVLSVHDAGTDSGLTLLMDIENDEYFYGEGSSAGIRVLIHDPDEVPMVGQYGFSVAPGTATSAAIKITEEIFAKNPYTDCVDPADLDFVNPLQHYDSYTQTGCKMEHIVDYVFGVCGCKQYYNPGNLTVCKTPTDIRCARAARRSYSQQAVQDLRAACPPLCRTYMYDTKLSYASFPAQHVVDELVAQFNYTEETLRKNVLLLKIYYQDLAIHKIVHRPAYSGVSLFADVGGQMGLCLGASMLTLVELFELAVVVICRACKPRKGHR